MVFEKKSFSDHIQIAFPSAKEKGEICVFGSLKGFSDYKTAQGELGSVNIGKPVSIFNGAVTDLTGTPAIGTDVYITSTNTLTTTAGSNKLFGTIVAFNAQSFDFAVTG